MQAKRVSRQARRLRGGRCEARENEWKGVFLNPETRITTFSESRFGSRFGIPHNSSQFVGKIRISPCRPSSAPAHCGNRVIDFMDASRPRLTFPGPRVAPSGEVKGERVTNHGFYAFHETRDTAFKVHWPSDISYGANQAPVNGFHETRDTKHESRPFCPVHHCSRLFTIVRYCSAKNIVQASAARHSSRLLQAAPAAANPR